MDSTVKRLFYQRLRDFIYHIPGDNPGQFTLCGTNCFVVGSGTNRVMVESGDYPERNQLFLENVSKFMNDYSHVRISKIFITHAHHDHFGGLYDLLRILFERGHAEPQVYKMLDGNKFELEVFSRFPQLRGKVHDLKHGDTFYMPEDKFNLRAIYTPGHATDHISMMLEPLAGALDQQQYLFSGDIILGAPSTSVQELKSYMNTLYYLRNESFNHICLPHTMDNSPDSIIVDGKPKLEAYIKYREDRDKAILECFKASGRALLKAELYDAIYGGRGLTGPLQDAAMRNLDLHLDKLVKEGYIARNEQNYKL